MALYSEKVMDHFRNPCNKDYYDRHGIAYAPAQFPDCQHCEGCGR